MVKIIDKTLQKATIIAFSLAVILNVFNPIGAFADTGTITLEFNFTVPEGNEAELSVIAQDRNTTIANNTAGPNLGGRINEEDSWHIVDVLYSDDSHVDANNVSVTCNSNKSCKMNVTIPSDKKVKFQTPGGTTYHMEIDGDFYNSSGETGWFNTNKNIEIVVDEPRIEFEGDAYVVWACNDGSTCLYEFQNIVTGNGTQYYDASNVKDTRTNQTFNAFGAGKTRGFIVSGVLEDWVNQKYPGKAINEVDWSQVDPELLLFGTQMSDIENQAVEAGACERVEDEDEFHSCIDQYVIDNNIEVATPLALQPLSDEPIGASMYTSYGDRNFKITIYNSNYKGLTFKDFSDLTYVPRYWSDEVRVDAIDMSETTKQNPASLEPNLLESTVNIKPQSYNNFDIASITALDVPEGAVTITPNGDGSYKIVFNSNYYDNVIFELKDSANNKYYLQINRITFIPSMLRPDFQRGNNTYGVQADFYYDENTNYTDYEIIATYVYKDGKRVQKKMENSGVVLENISDYSNKNSTDGGQGLKMSNFQIVEQERFEENIDEIYFNIRYIGSTDTNYKGTFAGSGNGIKMEIEHFE